MDYFGHMNRRNWLRKNSFSLGAVAFPWLLKKDGLLANQNDSDPVKPNLESVAMTSWQKSHPLRLRQTQ